MNPNNIRNNNEQSTIPSEWDFLALEKSQDTLARLTDDQMRERIKNSIGPYKEKIQPFVDSIDNDKCKKLIIESRSEPSWLIAQGFIRELARALGLKNRIDTWHDVEPCRRASAYYERGRNSIIINDSGDKIIKDPLDLIERFSTFAHETFHAYQYEQTLYGDQASATRYKNLFKAYKKDDDIAYCDSPIELEAFCFQDLVGHKILDNMHEMGENLDLNIY